jgi:hypothetical protein
MTETARSRNSGWVFFAFMAPLFVAALPSLLFCSLELILWLHGANQSPVAFHLPPVNPWDRLFAMETAVYQWISRWNAAVTLLATMAFVATLLRPRWRHGLVPALIPYSLLLCADFALRWRYIFLP